MLDRLVRKTYNFEMNSSDQVARKLISLFEQETYCRHDPEDLRDVLIDGQVDMLWVAERLIEYFA
jgi:hypothetical protein